MDLLRRPLLTGAMIAPAAALALLAFQSAGYFPGATAVAAIIALLALALWVLVAPRPFAGLTRAGLVSVVLLAAFALWTLLSGLWSHAPGRALIEFDRVLLYVAVLALFVLVGRTARRVRLLVAALAAAALLVSLVALGAWLLPDHVHVSQFFQRIRLSYPTGYWNTTGLLAGFGVIWSLHLSASTDEHVAVRAIAAGAIVPEVAVIVFTASRGAAVATGVGAIVYFLATRSATSFVALLAAVPATIAASLVVSGTPQLATTELTPAVIAKGHRAALELLAVAVAAAVLRLALGPLERRLEPVRVRMPGKRVLIAGAIALVAAAIVVDVPGRVAHEFQQFATVQNDNAVGTAHFASVSSNGRTDLWSVAIDHGFVPNPIHGSGAGTFPNLWYRYRTGSFDVLVAHSLYIGTLGELGLVGAVLLFGALLAIAAALLRRALSRQRDGGDGGTAWAAILGAAAAWVLFAAYDWNWQMPACTVWLMAAGGLALSRRIERGALPWRPRRAWLDWGARVAVAAAAVALAFVPHTIERSQSALDGAVADLQYGDCAGAVREASRSIAAVAQRPEPYMVLAYCAARAGHSQASLRYADAAVRRDPGSWQVYYAKGLVQAVAGVEPLAALHAARVHNPMGVYPFDALRAMRRAKTAAARRALALVQPIPLALRDCGGPDQADQLTSCNAPVLPTIRGTLIQAAPD